MKVEFFIAKRILFNKENKNSYTRPVINIAVWGIALGMIIMIMAISMTKGFQKEIKEKTIGFSSDIQISKTGIDESYESTPFLIDSSLYDRFNDHVLIEHAQVYATKAGIIKTKTNSHGTILKGVGKDFNWKFFKDNLVEGDTITLKKEGISREAIISKKIAIKLNLKLGDIFRVFFVTQRKNERGELQYRQKKNSFKVKGIYQTGLAEEFDSKFIFIDLKRVRKLNKWTPQQIGGYEIYMKEETSFLDLFNKNSGFEHYQNQENIIKDEFYSDVAFLDVRSIFSRYIQFISWIDYMDMHIGIILIIILNMGLKINLG